MLVGAAVVYTAHMTGIRLWNVHFKDVIVMVPLVNVVLFLPVFLLQPTSLDQIKISELTVQAVYQGIVVNIVALMCVAYAIHHLGTIVVSLFMSFVPVITAVFGWVFLGREPERGGTAWYRWLYDRIAHIRCGGSEFPEVVIEGNKVR